MPVTYDSYEAKVIERVINMLANSSTWQTLTGTLTATAAKAYIIESFGGDPRTNTATDRATRVDGSEAAIAPPLAIVHSDEYDAEPVALLTYDYRGTVVVFLYLAVDATDDGNETFRRARNSLGAIRDEMQALVASASTYLAEAHISSSGPTLPDLTGNRNDAIEAQLRITWRG